MRGSSFASRQAIAPYVWLKPWLRRLCKADREFPAYLNERAEHNHHYLALVNRALARAKPDLQPKDIALLLRSRPRNQVLRIVWPDHPPGLLSALRKMGPRLYWWAYYDRVLRRLSNSASAKVLHHADLISLDLLDTLDKIEPALHQPRFISILNGPGRVGRFRCMNAELMRVLPARHRRAAKQALARARMFPDIEEWFSRWAAKGSVLAAFRSELHDSDCYGDYCVGERAPWQTPWRGSTLLALLTTVEQIQSAGRRFNNCLSTVTWAELDGSRHFYEWRGPEPAMASIRFHSRLGWLIGEISGVSNRRVEAQTRDAIVAEFSQGDVRRRSDAPDRMDDATRIHQEPSDQSHFHVICLGADASV